MRLHILAALILAGCGVSNDPILGGNSASAQADRPGFEVQELAQFKEPWAMAFLPGTNQALITEKAGRLLLWSEDSAAVEVAGTPKVDYGGQGGLGDIVPHPDFARNRLVYLSWVEAGENDTRGAVVGRARLATDGGPRLDGLAVIWRQDPKVTGRGHYSHRIAFAPDGHLFITSGERQKFTPAQDMNQNLGKVIRLTDTGDVPKDNPFATQGAIASQIWSLGHRNLLGIAFAPDGRLWTHEMGPKGGDEVNLIERGSNYGYPIVSNGSHYDGKDIPDHDSRPEFNAPEVWWNPAISPAGMIVYSGGMFPAWQGDILMGALSGQALIRVDVDGARAAKGDQWDMDRRIREVEQGPDGSVYLLEDERNGVGGKLLKLAPVGG
ncbi:PQQ-dependent sugar dehydrogenase [Sphingosinicella rhizophila]|uniref:PQQ-dependent sugar dehydrogenase n=1 Tax=Sphingosinicella rhizophila TaxID=3050082 RepID=A0ABU3QDC3_9SPHN|nr:PQQ-dependent sugar dehydrogenase [Sphingosinicella sp. GR2756]MDT9600970.1 PQQ-dependent sugar dehydrogenase [Sphingosinicella sp. GR2756]